MAAQHYPILQVSYTPTPRWVPESQITARSQGDSGDQCWDMLRPLWFWTKFRCSSSNTNLGTKLWVEVEWPQLCAFCFSSSAFHKAIRHSHANIGSSYSITFILKDFFNLPDPYLPYENWFYFTFFWSSRNLNLCSLLLRTFVFHLLSNWLVQAQCRPLDRTDQYLQLFHSLVRCKGRKQSKRALISVFTEPSKDLSWKTLLYLGKRLWSSTWEDICSLH